MITHPAAQVAGATRSHRRATTRSGSWSRTRGARLGQRRLRDAPYEDWLDSVYDAWVARPGVPQTPFSSGRSRTARGTGGASDGGRAGPAPARLPRRQHRQRRRPVVDRQVRQHARPGRPGGRAHGAPGTTSCCDGTGRTAATSCCGRTAAASADRAGWRSPSATSTGGSTTASTRSDGLGDRSVRDAGIGARGPGPGILPFGGVGFDLIEQFDRLVEGQCRRRLRWGWREMKENAERASDPLPQGTKIPSRASSA